MIGSGFLEFCVKKDSEAMWQRGLWEQEGQGQYAWHVCLPLIPNPPLVYCELQNICFQSYPFFKSKHYCHIFQEAFLGYLSPTKSPALMLLQVSSPLALNLVGL